MADEAPGTLSRRRSRRQPADAHHRVLDSPVDDDVVNTFWLDNDSWSLGTKRRMRYVAQAPRSRTLDGQFPIPQPFRWDQEVAADEVVWVKESEV